MLPHPSDDAWPAVPLSSSDLQLICRVADRIYEEPRLERENVTIEAQNGVVILTGDVSRPESRDLAVRLARSAPGALDICDRLRLPRTAPDLFEEVIAHWDDEPPARRARRRRIAGAVGTVLAVALGLILAPQVASAVLLVVLPCTAVAAVLGLPSGCRQSSRNRHMVARVLSIRPAILDKLRNLRPGVTDKLRDQRR